MSFDLQRIFESEAAHRRKLADLPIGQQSRSGVPPLVSKPESGGTPLLLVDSKEGVPLAVARKAFGNDPKPINSCPPEPRRRREELNKVLVA